MACALLRMCIPAEHEDKDPAPPASRPCNTRPEIYASFIRSQPSALNAGAAADQRCDIDALGADLLSVILAHCDIRDIFSARGVCSQWREVGDAAALTAFKERWGLHSILGRPRHLAALLTMDKSAFVRQRQLQSHVDTLSSLAVACGTDVATLKRTNNIFSEHSLHTRSCIFMPAEDIDGNAEFYFCPFANRQFVIVHTEPGTQLSEELDPIAKQQAEDQAMAKLAQILSRSLRVELQQATFYLRAADGDIRHAMRLHDHDVRWERSRRRTGR